MKPAARLGLRLAWGSPGQRGRSVLVAIACALSAFVLLAVTASVRAETQSFVGQYAAAELQRLNLAVLATVALPTLALAASVGRLSATVRDRRLAGLRLLGVSPAETRLTAAVEAVVAALVGAVVGAVAFVALRPVLAGVRLVTAERTAAQLDPGWLGWLLALVGVPLAVVAVAVIPVRTDISSAVATANRADARRPSLWRAAPLALGLALCAVVRIQKPDNLGGAWGTVVLAGVTLVGLGIVLIVPVFVRLTADLLLRVATRPSLLVAARRLQAQPAGVTRTVAALMIGVFVVVGARGVLVAFETTPQYLEAKRSLESEQRLWTTASVAETPRAIEEGRALPGARSVTALPVVQLAEPGVDPNGSPPGGYIGNALVATCADLRRVAPQLRGCVDGRPTNLWPVGDRDLVARATVQSRSVGAEVPVVGTPVQARGEDPLGQNFAMVIPPSAPGIAALLPRTDRDVRVVAGPGRDLIEGPSPDANHAFLSSADLGSYDFVESLRRALWTVAGTILALGLLGLAITLIDRALVRRRELTSLRLVGTSPGTLRGAQWWEAALPIVAGGVLSVLAGALAGSAYLTPAAPEIGYPWGAVTGLLAAIAAGAVVVAALTAVATTTRIRPEEIRVE
ncbi:FtsX-like permease family protein [Barrientosiimonas humi]|uniref:FtsX-like permease family protein n=1 Tax=Barrientosiimonas humi TaxID=999931 RepID=UPI00370D3F16